MVGTSTAENIRQMAMLGIAPGEPMGGRVRYAAAMHFYQKGLISEECLEVYRMCCVCDEEDPSKFLARLGLAGEVDALKRKFEPSSHPPT